MDCRPEASCDSIPSLPAPTSASKHGQPQPPQSLGLAPCGRLCLRHPLIAFAEGSLDVLFDFFVANESEDPLHDPAVTPGVQGCRQRFHVAVLIGNGNGA